MKIRIFCTLAFATLLTQLSAQMWNGQDSLYGNEWINFEQSYYKIMVAEDGVYRLTEAELAAAGVPTENIAAGNYQLFYLGEEIPIYVNEDSGNDDYIEFYGKKNRSEVDRFLYKNPDQQILNPKYSLFTDTSAYFLTWSNAAGQRYAEAEANFENLPTAETTFSYEQDRLYTAAWYKENSGSSNLDYSSFFSKIEGFSQPLQNTQQVTLMPELLATGANSVEMEVQLLFPTGQHIFKATVNGAVQVETPLFNGYETRRYNWTIPVTSSNDEITALFEGMNSEFDRHSINYITLRYPRNFDFQNEVQTAFRIVGGDRKLLDINNFNHGGVAPILYDVTNGVRIPTRLQGNIVQAVLPTTTSAFRDLVLVNVNNGFKIDYKLRSQNFVDYRQQAADYLILTNPALYDDGSGRNMVQEYADYRSSAAGGDYNVTIAEIQQVYDQFGYGLNRHNIASQNFANYLREEWEDWRFTLLLGKSFTYDAVRSTEQLTTAANEFHLPTYGSPGADPVMFAKPHQIISHIGVGRLPVTNGKDIQIYLDKLKSFEDQHQNAPQTLAAREWMHRAMHLGGGITPSEQGRIKSGLDQMAGILENNHFGADVTSFFKTSSESIQVNQSAALTNLINNGISLLTFFGHSSSNTFDFSLDSPENYENQDRYPIISSYGCYAGLIHQSGRSIGERFIFAEERGAIGFMASVSQAYIRDLRPFGEAFFRALGDDYYGESIGEIQRITSQRLLAGSAINENRTLHQLLMQTTFQGDPAIRLSYATTPDYLSSTASVTIEPALINVETVDTIVLNFDLINLGKNEPNTINVLIEQELPTGDRVTHLDERISMTQFRRSLTYQLPVLGDVSIGLNRLHITIDNEDVVVELPSPDGELNNNLVDGNNNEGIEFLVFSNDARPLYPTRLGIVSKRDLTLKASTTNTFAETQRYVFEMDTTALFDSDIKERFTLEQTGGVLKWQPSINYQDSTVYYWRVSPDSTAQFDYIWQESSFIFLENSEPGFNQSHYFQQTESTYSATQLLENRTLEFGKIPVTYQLKNGINAFFNAALLDQSTNNITSSSVIGGPGSGGAMVLVFDGLTGEIWTNTPTGVTENMERQCVPAVQLGEYDSQLSFNETNTKKGFKFRTETLEDRQRLIKFLDEDISEGSYVAFFTLQRPYNPSSSCHSYFPERWAADSVATDGRNIFNVLEREGARAIRGLQNAEFGNVPYVFAYRKGDPSVADVEQSGDTEDAQSFFVAPFTVPSVATKGTVSTPLIGPATSWKRLEWKTTGKDSEADMAMLNIYGYNLARERSLIFRGLELETSTLNSVDAQEFPFLQLEYEAEDLEKRTPQQLEHWRVFFDGIPEASLNQSAAFLAVKDTLEQGEPLEFMIAAENVSDYNLDSLLVQYSITDAANNEFIVRERVAPLVSNDTLQLRLKYDTQALSGAQTLRIEINPDEDQLELTHINNVGFIQFFVRKDERNPLLDVAFDGIRIMNGDIVSPDPLITIVLDDENDYLRLADTSLFQISVIYPDNSQRALSFDRNADILQFIPAAADANNRAIVEYSPVFEENGAYTLVVQARDATGNKSGNVDYRVDFEVVVENAISNVFNFPNPFTTSTHFVYTLTGQTPEYFSIDIMTVSGRVVRQLTQDEIGQLRIGTHQTEYAWDGTDEYGDQLANGVYLYRIVTKNAAGEDYDKRETGTDDFFRNNMGKMVLIR